MISVVLFLKKPNQMKIAKVLLKRMLFVAMFLGVRLLFAQSINTKLQVIQVEPKLLGTRYIYEHQTIDNPLALQIPLLQLKDPEVSREFLRFKQQRKLVQTIGLGSTLFSLYAILNRDKIENGTYWTVVGTTALVSGYLNLKSNIHLYKSVERYNTLVGNNQLGLTVAQHPFNKQAVVGLAFKHEF